MKEVLKDVLGYSIKSLFREVAYMVSGYMVSFDTVHLAICNLCRIIGVWFKQHIKQLNWCINDIIIINCTYIKCTV